MHGLTIQVKNKQVWRTELSQYNSCFQRVKENAEFPGLQDTDSSAF